MKDSVIKLDIGYKDRALYKNVEMNIPRNGVVSIIGDNGSGKSTFYKTLLGIIPPLKGKISQDVLRQIAVVSDYVHLPEEVTVWDILCLLGSDKVKFAEVNYPDFHTYVIDIKEQRIKTLSSGQRRIVEIYSVLASKKKIIVLDEASNSLDFSNRELFLSHVKKLANDKILFFHTSHEIHDVISLGGTVYGLFKSEGAIKQYMGKLNSEDLHMFLAGV